MHSLTQSYLSVLSEDALGQIHAWIIETKEAVESRVAAIQHTGQDLESLPLLQADIEELITAASALTFLRNR